MLLTPMVTNIENNPILKRLHLKINSYKSENTNLDNYLKSSLNRILTIKKEINSAENITKINLSQS